VGAAHRQPLARLRADAVDPAYRQWPDALPQVVAAEDRQSVRLVEVGGDLRQQLVGRDADRTRQPGRLAHRVLDALRERAGLVGQRAQVEVDLVDAAVFALGCDARDGGLEESRVMAIGGEIDRQQDRVRRQAGRLHDAHRRRDAQRACFVGGGGDDAAADVVAQACELPAAIRQQQRLLRTAAADHQRLATQFRVAQQIDRGVEGVHVEVRDAARRRAQGFLRVALFQAQCRLALIRPDRRDYEPFCRELS